jgi:hypothetical protein
MIAPSRWVRVSSTFSPERRTSSTMPGWRPKSVPYCSHRAPSAAAEMPSTSQREGIGARTSVT